MDIKNYLRQNQISYLYAVLLMEREKPYFECMLIFRVAGTGVTLLNWLLCRVRGLVR